MRASIDSTANWEESESSIAPLRTRFVVLPHPNLSALAVTKLPRFGPICPAARTTCLLRRTVPSLTDCCSVSIEDGARNSRIHAPYVRCSFSYVGSNRIHMFNFYSNEWNRPVSHVLIYSILTCFGLPVLGGTASAHDV